MTKPTAITCTTVAASHALIVPPGISHSFQNPYMKNATSAITTCTVIAQKTRPAISFRSLRSSSA
jgi:hypothetical protein